MKKGKRRGSKVHKKKGPQNPAKIGYKPRLKLTRSHKAMYGWAAGR